MSRDNLATFEKFLQQFIGDEICVHLPTRYKTTIKSPRSQSKVMASILWEAKKVLLIDNLEKGHSVTAAHYTDLLRELWEKVMKILCGKLAGGVLFHQDKAPAHSDNGCDPGIGILTHLIHALFILFGALRLLRPPQV